MKFLQWFKRSWLAQLVTIMLIIWPPLMIVSLVDYPWMVSDTSIVVMVFCGIFALVCGVFVLKHFAKNRANVPAIHWVDVFINRILLSIVLLVVLGAFSGLLVAPETETGSVSAIVFAGIGGVYMLFGWILSHIYIKQAIITEGTLKALELYNGQKRSVSYGAKQK